MLIKIQMESLSSSLYQMRAAFYSYFLVTADSSLLTEKAKTDVLEESRHAVRSMSKAEFFEWFAEHWKANAG